MAQQTLINGNRFSFTDIRISIAGFDQPAVFTALNYKSTQEPGIVQANQVAPVGRTSGYGTATGGFTMLISEWDDLATTLSDQNPSGAVMNTDFDIQVSYNINDTDIRTDNLIGCRITDMDVSVSKGNEAVYMVLQLSIMRVQRNGIDDFSLGDQNNG